jgi:sortase A
VTVRRALRATGWTFIGMGGFVLYFLVYQLVGTNAVTNAGQSDLRNELQREWSAQPAPRGDPKQAAPRRVARGKGLAVIDIPKIQLENKVVVEGVGRQELRKGPGHIPSTVPPGQAGTFGISGHRTTYGAPFYRLDELAKGDTITVVTREAIYTYTVTRTAIVRPTDTQVLDNVRGANGRPKPTITLTTCHPRYSARQRLVIFGDLSLTSPNTGKVAA